MADVTYFLLEMIARFLSLDFGWFFGLAMNNLVWVFAFLALAYFFWEKTPLIIGFAAVVLYAYGSIAFTALIGWPILIGSFLLLAYIARISVATFSHYDETLTAHLPLILVIQFFVILAVYNLFLK